MALGDKTVIRGDSDDFTIKFTDDNNVALDLTGWTVWFTVRKTWVNEDIVDDIDAPISRKITEFPINGQVTISITSEETTIKAGEYHYDIQYKKPNGKIKSITSCKYIIRNDVTRDS
jgi:hypothetical protein